MGTAKLNAIFRGANESRHRYKIMYGSAGSGKSVNIATDFIIKLSSPEYAGCSLLVVRGVEVSHLNSTFAELMAAISRLGLGAIWQSKLNPLSLRCAATGNAIIFRGCSDLRAIERLKSVTVPNGKITFVWIEEATELKQSDFEAIDDRLRGELPDGHYFQIVLSFNPVSSAHWIKTKLVDYADSSHDIYVHKSTYLDNAFIDAEYRKRMERRREVDPEGFMIYGLGEWGEIGGLIYENVAFGDYQGKQFEHCTIGCDWGFAHATVILLVGWHDGEPYVTDEVYSVGQTTEEVITQCNAAKFPKDVTAWADSAEPARIRQFKQGGYKIFPVKKEKNSIINQITWLKGRKIYIDAGKCPNTQREIQQYKWAKNPTSGEYEDTPVNFGDDCMKALAYACESDRKQTRIKTMNKGDLGIW